MAARVAPAGLAFMQVERVHAAWLACEPRPRHPLAPVLEAWQDRPTAVEVFRPVNRASLPRFHKTIKDDARTLPALYGRAAVTEYPQRDLPGILEMPSCTPWLLSLFDRAGGRSLAQGRGAPWALRLFVGALLHLRVSARDSTWRQLEPLETEEVIRWLHPDGWASSNKSRDWEKFPAALDELSRLGVYLPGIGEIRPVMASVIPRQPADRVVQFVAMVPRAAAKGARIDWPTLCRYGTKNAGVYRAYLTACAILGESAHHGHPITQEINPPVLDAAGRPVRRTLKDRKGKDRSVIVRDTDRTEANTAARYVKAYTEAELAQIIGFDGTDRFMRRHGMKAWAKLAEDGVIDLVQDGKRWRIFGPGRGE